jgi:pyrroline-5-carboxylate reductase
MTEQLPSLAILGTGSMGGAILHGLRQPGVSVPSLRATTRTDASAAALRERGIEARATEHEHDANLWAVEDARLVLLGVKPAQILPVLDELAAALHPEALIVSVAAGVTTRAMEERVAQAVVRAMPNTPALVGRGVTGVSGGARATAADLALATVLFRTVGTVIELPEAQIDALSTVSGSGPAYVFLLIEEFTRAAEELGFEEEVAALMVQQTFLGASLLLEAGDADPAELRRRVTSPKGTTERAVAVLQEAELAELFGRATRAALARAQELAAGG